jgi:serine/threonine protein phosphatase PrpC/TolA-binding protein
MDVAVGIVCDRGLNPKRPVNQDSYLAIQDRGLFAVFDGVGGQRAGEVASQTAAETVEESLAHDFPNDPAAMVRRAIQFANRDIFELAESDPAFKTMATTVALVLLDGDGATIAHVGDSRVYRLENGSLFRETIDHTDLDDDIRAGRLTPEQAALYQDDHVINRALGVEPNVDVEIKTISLGRGDRMLLCTDGIYRHMTDDQIGDVLAKYKDPQRAADEFKRIVHQRGADDNLTAVVVHVRDLGASALSRPSRVGQRTSGRLREAARSLRGKESAQSGAAKRIKVNLDTPTGITRSEPRGSAGESERLDYKETVARSRRSNVLIYVLLSLVLLAGGFYAGLRAPELMNKRASKKSSVREQADPMAAGREAFDRRDYAAAAAAFGAVQQREPQNAQAYYWLGRAQLEQGQYAEAARSLEQAVTLAPDMHDAYVQAAAALESAGERTRAADMLQRYVQERKKAVASSQ